jgi:VanZ family protein
VKKILWYWLPVAAWMTLIFAVSAQPELPLPPGPWLEGVLDKVGHALSYGVLAWLVYRALKHHFAPSAILRGVCVAVAVAYGLTDEVHQAFVPGREPSLLDLGADALGALAAVLIAAWLERRRAADRRPSGAR